MKRQLPRIVFFALFLIGAGWLSAAGQDKKKADAKTSPLEGTWSVTKGDSKIVLTFVGDKFTFAKSRGDKSEDIVGTFKYDTNVSPNTIDMSVTGGTSGEAERFKGKTSLGIFKIEGTKFEWCAAEPGKDFRPNQFVQTEGDKKYLLIQFDRAKK